MPCNQESHVNSGQYRHPVVISFSSAQLWYKDSFVVLWTSCSWCIWLTQEKERSAPQDVFFYLPEELSAWVFRRVRFNSLQLNVCDACYCDNIGWSTKAFCQLLQGRFPIICEEVFGCDRWSLHLAFSQETHRFSAM